jgi:hypothetical protein
MSWTQPSSFQKKSFPARSRPDGVDRNPDNFFAETEQVAFCASHAVPRIGQTRLGVVMIGESLGPDTQLFAFFWCQNAEGRGELHVFGFDSYLGGGDFCDAKTGGNPSGQFLIDVNQAG